MRMFLITLSLLFLTSCGSYGATGDSVFIGPLDGGEISAASYPSLTTAITAATTNNKGLLIDTIWVVDSLSIDVSLPIHVVKGGGFNNSGVLDIPGVLDAGPYQIFFGTGSVTNLRKAVPDWFGENTSPGTTNITAAWALSFASSKLILPDATTYLLDTISIPAGTIIKGQGIDKTIIKQGTNTGASYGVFFVDSGSSSAKVDDISVFDLTLDGQVASKGFSQYEHLVSFSGVNNVLFDRVKFLGYRGDGLYLGSSPTAATERHNSNVKVQNCIFDGVNKDNRNGISVIDGTGITIQNNTFRNSTKTGMPGAIDFEPNNNAFHVIKNIKVVNNRFSNCGGGYGTVVYTNSSVLTNPLHGVTIEGNTYDSDNTYSAADILISTIEDLATVPLMGITVRDNKSTSPVEPLALYFVNGIEVTGNVAAGTSITEIGKATTATLSAKNVKYHHNTLSVCGNAVGAIQEASVDFLDIYNNTITPSATGLNGITFFGSGVTTDSSYVSIKDNRFIKGASQTRAIHTSSHTYTPTTNNYSGNTFSATLTNSFESDQSDSSFTDFTPVATGGTSSGTGTYTTQSGKYQKVGNLVFVKLVLIWSAHTGTGTLRISLPFTVKNDGIPTAANITYLVGVTFDTNKILMPEFENNKAYISFYEAATNTGATALDIEAAASLYLSGWIEVE